MLKALIDEMPVRVVVVAELTPVPPNEGISLSRWSRLKRAAADEQAAAPAVRAEPIEAVVAAEKSNDRISPNAKDDAAANADYAELPPISAISLAEDFTPFMQAKVPQALKRQALKALFKEPHFNVMDGLDIYIDDYTVFEPISPEVMATLSSWKTIMNPPQQVVTNGGYAVDVESEEGKAVLAARAELAEVDVACQAAVSDVQVPSPAARERAEGEGDDMQKQTLQASDELALEVSAESSEFVLATPLTPTPVQNSALVRERDAGAGAKPHVRYGKRVGDFSASNHAAVEQSSLDPANTEPDQTASAAAKTIT